MKIVDKMIEIFKTNVLHNDEADNIISRLLHHFPTFKINFDLEDCDKILRVQGDIISTQEVAALLKHCGYICEALE